MAEDTNSSLDNLMELLDLSISEEFPEYVGSSILDKSDIPLTLLRNDLDRLMKVLKSHTIKEMRVCGKKSPPVDNRLHFVKCSWEVLCIGIGNRYFTNISLFLSLSVSV